ncbi:BTB/POZ domain-containing protein At3g44820-like isoform X1 [Typha angustifolia]|uniref:BTB/POZ domain-containing protein At3g44820-like isoform X1 n=1 Tax=Typha angustifolia TaxID=59011 RepID=UPI003C2C773C
MASSPTDRRTRMRTYPFYREGDHWFYTSGLPSNIIIEVDGIYFHLHKFPLFSRCGKIMHLLEDSQKTDQRTHYSLVGCPGGSEAFLFASKFCYGSRVELTSQNILMVYCAAEYLEMTEKLDEDNLLVKAESFIQKVILNSWKDCILALQSAEVLISNIETIHIVRKCLNALSMMACTDSSLFGWPMMMYGSLQSPGGSILWNGINTGASIRSSLSDWWFEDISCLGLAMFKRLIETMRERRMRSESIAGALMYYARKYIPGLDRWHREQGDRTRNLGSFGVTFSIVDQRVLLEAIENLLPDKIEKSYCCFLLGLLRIALLLNVHSNCKDSLERRIGVQLELANLDGLLIPNFQDSDNLYDTDCVERIILHFVSSEKINVASFSTFTGDPATPSFSKFREVSKLIDNYLAEVAPDINLIPEKMHYLLMAFPESLRSLDDGLYRAIDIYFKAHPWISEDDRVKLFSVIDCSKLSIDACAHASQNERLPFRIVLQVLFFEQLQLRAALSHCHNVIDSDDSVTGMVDDMVGQIVQRDGWVSLVRENEILRVDMEHMRSRVRGLEQEVVNIKQGIGRVTRSHSLISSASNMSRKLGCIHVPQMNNQRSTAVLSTSQNPRQSV